MPYKSDKQRRFFHTDTAKKAGITSDEVKEFDQASKGKKLPEKAPKKMNQGGQTGDQFMQDEQEGFRNGINGDWEAIKAAIANAGNTVHSNYETAMGDAGNLKGLQDVMNNLHGIPPQAAPIEEQHTTPEGNTYSLFNNVTGMAFGGETNPKRETIKAMENNPTAGFAKGGMVKSYDMGGGVMGLADGGYPTGQEDLPELPSFDVQNSNTTVPLQGSPASIPTPTPQNNPPPPPQFTVKPPLSISQAAQNLNQTPSTSPDIYQGITAEDRAALAQKLMAQQASPGNILASGAAGLGDAIAHSFGEQNTNYQTNLRENMTKNRQEAVGITDVERQQKVQDVQARIAVQEADPNSPYSQGMRQFLQAQGMKVPSGMSAAMLKSTLPDVTKIFDAKLVSLAAIMGHKIEAGKALVDQPFWRQMMESMGLGSAGAEEGEAALEQSVGGTAPTGTSIPLPGGGSYSVRK